MTKKSDGTPKHSPLYRVLAITYTQIYRDRGAAYAKAIAARQNPLLEQAERSRLVKNAEYLDSVWSTYLRIVNDPDAGLTSEEKAALVEKYDSVVEEAKTRRAEWQAKQAAEAQK